MVDFQAPMPGTLWAPTDTNASAFSLMFFLDPFFSQRKLMIGEPKEDHPQDRYGILRGFELRIGSKLISNFPQPFFCIVMISSHL
jgi:hypothetical protein